VTTIVSFGRDKSYPGKAPWTTLIFAIAMGAFTIPALKLNNIITLDRRAAPRLFGAGIGKRSQPMRLQQQLAPSSGEWWVGFSGTS
jgi:hypothetical protein